MCIPSKHKKQLGGKRKFSIPLYRLSFSFLDFLPLFSDSLKKRTYTLEKSGGSKIEGITGAQYKVLTSHHPKF